MQVLPGADCRCPMAASPHWQAALPHSWPPSSSAPRAPLVALLLRRPLRMMDSWVMCPSCLQPLRQELPELDGHVSACLANVSDVV